MSTTTPPPDLDLGSVDLLALERRFQQALAAGDAGALPVVGYGEISVTFGWPPANPRIAVKSLPVFEDLDRLRAYAALVEGYIDRLRDRRVHVLPTAVRWSRAPGGWRGYLLQPLLPQGSIGPRVLAHGGPEAEGMLDEIVEVSLHAIGPHVGLDCQVSNWALVDGQVCYLDVGTPMLRDASGRDRLDIAILATSVPWVLRPLTVRVVGPQLLAPYHDPRRALLDAAGNLIRERLDRWIGPFLERANHRLDRELTAPEVHRFYRWNARTYAALQAVRKLDRAWQSRVRHRPYGFLLPEHIER